MRYGIKHKFPKFLFKIMALDSKTVKRVNIGLSLEVFYYLLFSLRPMKSGQDNIAGRRLLYLKAMLDLKGNTFV